jgi:mannose/fructose-specific phosphotransferase system component IIA
MIGMILVTHGKLAEEFVHAMEHVVGRQEAVATVCIGPNDDVEKGAAKSPAPSRMSTAAMARSS